MPTVVAASRDITVPRVDVVANDDWIGTELAVNHLIGLGHRRIAHLAGSFGAVAELRRRSYLATMDATRSRRSDPDRTLRHDRGGRIPGGRPLLGRPDPPTAIFAVNDITCIGAMSAAQQLGSADPARRLAGRLRQHLARPDPASVADQRGQRQRRGRAAGRPARCCGGSPIRPPTPPSS